MTRRCPVLALGLAGCVLTTIHQIPINAPPHAMVPRPVSTVDVFSAGRPERPFVDVAYLEAEVVRYEEPTLVFAKLRAQAAAAGCDGIIFQGATARDKGEAQHGYAATCIVYR